MVEYHCDGCGQHVEHSGPNYPRGWTGVIVKVEWASNSGEGHNEWESDNPVLLCPKCRGPNGGDLEERAVNILRKGVKRRRA